MTEQRLCQKKLERILKFLLVSFPLSFGNAEIMFSQKTFHRSISLKSPSQITFGKSSHVIDEKQSSYFSGQNCPITISRKSGEDQVIHDEANFLIKLLRNGGNTEAVDEKVEFISLHAEKRNKPQLKERLYR